jgi:hypothetical protein
MAEEKTEATKGDVPAYSTEQERERLMTSIETVFHLDQAKGS